MSTTDDDFDNDYVDDSHVSPRLSRQEILKRRIARVLPYLPYVILTVGAQRRSTNLLVAAVFTMLAVKPFKRFVTINNCQFTAGASGPGLVVA